MLTLDTTNAMLDAQVRERLYRSIAWHVSRADSTLSDHDLVMMALNRYRENRGLALIDPNE